MSTSEEIIDLPSPPATMPPISTGPLHSRKHPGRWLSGSVAVAVLGWLALAFAHSKIDWSVVAANLSTHAILIGFVHTIVLSALSMLLGLALGTVFAVMRLSRNPVTSGVAWLYVWLFRGTPVFLQLLIWFNLAIVFPTISIPGVFTASTITVITPFVAALLGLGINEGSYLTEIIRGGILSVDPGQEEAATAAGFTRPSQLRLIILPQALPAIIPTIGNEAIGMLKTSALAASISYSELLNAAQQSYYQNARVIELLFVAAIWYLVATSATSVGQYYLELRINRGRINPGQVSLADRMIRHLFDRWRGR